MSMTLGAIHPNTSNVLAISDMMPRLVGVTSTERFTYCKSLNSTEGLAPLGGVKHGYQ